MDLDIFDRVILFSNYILDNNATIRACAKYFNVAKSTVHHDLKYRLPHVDMALYNKVREILVINFEEKHIRGGEATKQKYLHEHEINLQ